MVLLHRGVRLELPRGEAELLPGGPGDRLPGCDEELGGVLVDLVLLVQVDDVVVMENFLLAE